MCVSVCVPSFKEFQHAGNRWCQWVTRSHICSRRLCFYYVCVWVEFSVKSLQCVMCVILVSCHVFVLPSKLALTGKQSSYISSLLSQGHVRTIHAHLQVLQALCLGTKLSPLTLTRGMRKAKLPKNKNILSLKTCVRCMRSKRCLHCLFHDVKVPTVWKRSQKVSSEKLKQRKFNSDLAGSFFSWLMLDVVSSHFENVIFLLLLVLFHGSLIWVDTLLCPRFSLLGTQIDFFN